MKLSFHGPVPIQEDLRERLKWGLGGRPAYEVYGLGHVCLEDEDYREFIRTQGRDHSLILDNGADELGESMDPAMFRELIDELSPSVVVLPDKLKDWDATREMSELFFFQNQPGLPQVTWMGVAQGETEEEFTHAFRYWLGRPGVQVIGVPYDFDFEVEGQDARLTEDNFTRNQIRAHRRHQWLVKIHSVAGQEIHERGKKIHLLGANCPSELTRIGKSLGQAKTIRSHDTTMPIAAGYHDRLFLEQQVSGVDSYVLMGDKDWPPIPHEMEVTPDLVERVGELATEYMTACRYF